MKKFKSAKFPCIIQPKLDGIFCRAVLKNGICVLYTKNDNKINSVPHINKQLEKLHPSVSCTIEGEFYNHEITFQDIISIVKRNGIHKDSKLIQFWQFKDSSTESSCIKNVPDKLINNTKEFDLAYNQYLNMTYEGLIYHENGESFKLKPVLDSEYEIIEVIEGNGKLENKASTFRCKTLTGEEFKAKLKGKFTYLENILKNKDKIIGEFATIEYLNLTNRGVPRHGNVKVIRDYE